MKSNSNSPSGPDRAKRGIAAARAGDDRSSILMAALWATAALLALALSLQANPAWSDNGRPGSFADLAEELSPAVVNVSTTQVMEERFQGPEMPQFPPGSPFEEFFREFFEQSPGMPQQRQGPPRRAQSLGSGFIIDGENGYIVTNNHVIDGADEINVTLHDDSSYSATVVGTDERTDIAVLQIEGEFQSLPSVSLGDSDTMRVGDWVVAIGNPFGLGGTVTAGIISARSRDIAAGPYDDFLQTDASINRGNSGGPMFNLDGEVIGINTAIYSPSGGSIGIGFAIPSNLADSVIDQIVEFGRTRRGWLGVRIQQVTDEIAESLGMDTARGALVAGVTPEGPAAQAGIEAGDVVLEFNGEQIDEMRSLPRIVAETPVGSDVEVVILRRGDEQTVRVDLGELERAEEMGMLEEGAAPDRGAPDATSQELEGLGLELSAITSDLRQQFDLAEDVEGVVITDVNPDSAAAERGLTPGEVILEVGQESVSTPEDVVSMVDEAREAGRRSVLLLIDRGGEIRFVALSIQDN
ncbi:DegQ family serine endoprotease [Fodinicurvata sp. EGI_FJ10296]|uniref:DegQ family serine endoprotease n=1 Tax=Fodinicurvata sp. EGI_FJ10296 TaxID=3231908 RepID=UPI003451B632